MEGSLCVGLYLVGAFFALHYQQDLSFREVAYVMELTPGRISQLHTQALVRLRGMLAKEQEDSRED